MPHFCHDGLEKTAEVVACAPCGARFHQACLQANEGRCPACGATEVLLPPRPRSRRRDPPAGSKIQVARDDERTTFSWDPRTRSDTFLMWLFALMLLTLPLAWLWWRARKRYPRAEVVLGDETLEFDAISAHTLKGSRVKVRREEVGAVRVSAMPGEQQYALTVDVGIERHRVMTGLAGSALTPPELEWLAAEIQGWAAG